MPNSVTRFQVPILAVLAVIAAALVLHFGIDVSELVSTAGVVVAAVAAIVAMVTKVTPVSDPKGVSGIPLVPMSGDEVLRVEDVNDDLGETPVNLLVTVLIVVILVVVLTRLI